MSWAISSFRNTRSSPSMAASRAARTFGRTMRPWQKLKSR